MSTRNYDTQDCKKYVRLQELVIRATGKTNEYSITATERDAVLLATGDFAYVDSPASTLSVLLDINDTSPVPIVNPATDENIAGAFTNAQQAFACVFAVLRKHQRARDAAEAAAQGG